MISSGGADGGSARGPAVEGRRPTHLVRDERGGIASLLIRLIIFFAVMILAINEVGQVIIAQAHVAGAADAAAEAAASTFRSTHSEVEARAAAADAAQKADAGARVTRLTIATDGSASVTVALTARTLVLRRVSFLRRFGVVHSTEVTPALP